MRVLLVRHPAPSIEPGICYGRLDIPLSSEGTADAVRLACNPVFGGVARVWSSPARRCRSVAEMIGEPVIDPRLWELDFGAWEGRPWDDVPRGELDRWTADPMAFRAPGGESGAELIERVRSFHADLVRDDKDCAVVSHGGPLKVLSALIHRQPVNLLTAPPAIGTIQSIDC